MASQRVVPEHPTRAFVSKYYEEFERDARYFRADNAIAKLFRQFPENRDLEEVLLKVTVLDALYSTNVYAILEMARRIVELNIDREIEEHSTQIVGRIARIELPEGKKKTCYSFATKYCSWHDPNNYPIFDKHVGRLILSYRDKDDFFQFDDQDLRDYAKYKRIIDAFRAYYGLESVSFKELDKFLWLYGKELFP